MSKAQNKFIDEEESIRESLKSEAYSDVFWS